MSVSSETSDTDLLRETVSMCSSPSVNKLESLSYFSYTEEDSSPETKDGVRRCDFCPNYKFRVTDILLTSAGPILATSSLGMELSRWWQTISWCLMCSTQQVLMTCNWHVNGSSTTLRLENMGKDRSTRLYCLAILRAVLILRPICMLQVRRTATNDDND